MAHFVRCQNVPFSIEDIQRMSAFCPVCAELEPRFCKATSSKLIKATLPFKKININFKGSLPSVTNSHHVLTVVDEFSRFPFSLKCADMTAETVIKCLYQMSVIFDLPSDIHSHRGPCFMSDALKKFPHGCGIATSRTTAYNPQENGLVERYNGVVWKAVTLALKSRGLMIVQ